MAAISAKVEMIDVGIATRRDQRGADVGQKDENDDRGQDAAFDQMLFERMHRRS